MENCEIINLRLWTNNKGLCHKNHRDCYWWAVKYIQIIAWWN